mmetsp:Transcript_40113/g.87614  ORF Transcript_40113/g.87614 Transcript_40113/m.87614 type:complete len:251 (+) Transcript_40113:319-1071(+)
MTMFMQDAPEDLIFSGRHFRQEPGSLWRHVCGAMRSMLLRRHEVRGAEVLCQCGECTVGTDVHHLAPVPRGKPVEATQVLREEMSVEEDGVPCLVNGMKRLSEIVEAQAGLVSAVLALELHELRDKPGTVGLVYAGSLAIAGHLRLPGGDEPLLRVTDECEAEGFLHDPLLLRTVADHRPLVTPALTNDILRVGATSVVPGLTELLLKDVRVQRAAATLGTAADDKIPLRHVPHENLILLRRAGHIAVIL